MNKKLRVLVVGVGNMGASHARAYFGNEGFELVGLVARSPRRAQPLSQELGNVEIYYDFDEALQTAKPDVVSINTYPDTHKVYAQKSLESGAHIFIEKPLAETVEEAEEIVALARAKSLKIVVGYILRQHPTWIKFIEIAQTLGSPLVMRMNLNQQSHKAEWETHKSLMASISPIVDCGVHYVDVMCQMTRSKPVKVSAIGARLTDEVAPDMYNYGQLQVTFEDGSVGWYEAAWGPMISETAYFVKDVMGPKGCASIVEPNSETSDSSEVDSHVKTNELLVHHEARDEHGDYLKEDERINTSDEPGHQELCDREQAHLLRVINEDLDVTKDLEDALNSMRIVAAADTAVRTGKEVFL